MKRTLSSTVILALIVLTGSVLVAAVTGTQYGAGVTVAQPTTIETLLAKPADFVGKKVAVEGTITDVCQTRGCWMQLTDDKGQSIRVKVDDGVIVFPYTAKGQKAAAEGVFEAVKLSPEQIAARKAKAAGTATAHAGHSEGCAKGAKDGDKAAGSGEGAGCDAPAVNDTVYLIKGTGAVIAS